MNKSPNGCCNFCKQKETLLHLFVHCKLIDNIWKFITGKINVFNLRTEQAELYNNQKRFFL